MQIFRVTSVLAMGFLACAAVSQVASVKKPTKPDPEIAVKIAELEKALKDRKMSLDEGAILIIDELGHRAEGQLYSSDRKKVVKIVSKALTSVRLRPPEKTGLYRSAATALGKAGKNGAKALHAAYTKKYFPMKKEWTHMRANLLLNLGKIADPGMVKFLCDRAGRSFEDEVLAAAGDALGSYKDSDQKVRKEIAKALIIKLGGLEASLANNTINIPGRPQNFSGANVKRTIEVIGPTWNATLTSLTGHSLASGSSWTRWWNKNKRKDWDKDR